MHKGRKQRSQKGLSIRDLRSCFLESRCEMDHLFKESSPGGKGVRANDRLGPQDVPDFGRGQAIPFEAPHERPFVPLGSEPHPAFPPLPGPVWIERIRSDPEDSSLETFRKRAGAGNEFLYHGRRKTAWQGAPARLIRSGSETTGS